MSEEPQRRLSTGGRPPRKTRARYNVEKLSSHDETPGYTFYVSYEGEGPAPADWPDSDSDQRPEKALQIYDTTPGARHPKKLKAIARSLHKDVVDAYGDLDDYRFDAWGLLLNSNLAEDERIARCKEHFTAELASLSIPEEQTPYWHGRYISDNCWRQALIIIDRSEELWDDGDGGFLVVRWELQRVYLSMLKASYGEEYPIPKLDVRRCTHEKLMSEIASLTGLH